VTRPLAGHRSFGPYCGCRYVGRTEEHGDVEVWLLYDGQPHAADVPLVGILYNRITARGTDRIDHWIARPHRPDHQGDANAFEGRDGDAAARELWQALTGGSAAAAAAQAGPGVDCGGGCGAPAAILGGG
jgi:hypothetical protein